MCVYIYTYTFFGPSKCQCTTTQQIPRFVPPDRPRKKNLQQATKKT